MDELEKYDTTKNDTNNNTNTNTNNANTANEDEDLERMMAEMLG